MAIASYATSGLVYRSTVDGSRVCIQAWVNTNGTPIVMNGGEVRTYDTSGGLCDGSRNRAAGWIGIRLTGYRDGVACASTPWLYTSSTTSVMSYQTNLCSDPSGVQEFYTRVDGRVYNGTGYTSIPAVYSPSQNN